MTFLMKTAALLTGRRPRAVTSLALLMWLGTAVGPAAAHITLEYQVANAGSYYKANFKVGHGCADSPIQQIIVIIPVGVQGAKPMPKAGWTIDIQRDKLAKPYDDHGRPVTEEVARISWTAKTPADYLPSTHYDEFALQARLPAQAGPLYWAVSQVCEQGRIDWNETPKAGQKGADLKAPAALLEILPTAGAGHQH
jgi:uncharacterized protein YcnI